MAKENAKKRKDKKNRKKPKNLGGKQHNDKQHKKIKKESKEPLIIELVLRDDYAGFHAVTQGLNLRPGDFVLVEFPEQKEVARVVSLPVRVPISPEMLSVLPKVKRLASAKEIERYRENLAFEEKAWSICEQLAEEQGLEMKLVRVERLFDRSKVIFYYTADGRIDFRQLVKDLVRALRTRIEMRQIGVRHEAGMVGGIGCCGREICCATFLKKFDPVSIKIAKEQSLPLDPVKISGICGRLLCCLLFEHNVYAELSASLPKIGKKVSLEEIEGRVVRYNIFRESVTIETSEGEEVEISVEDFRKEF
ncbi:PSP1 domain protein [Thermodesulfatator indicus DSM 15286]|uniref:PSP1 domain protein n=1 Tax=Thermodesulfatator indicus (strain DSM 15286 / JCM 11887 / CIR29812) TaxID=667014 RepID=F8ADF3_THEID|nr:regulatory iron-sulfur-containing complex subunit RicT [Thermodesulfatator indicus]AEH45969.1 PSP1 domain protein [Thermodesulfatator indicus DSM 15286]